MANLNLHIDKRNVNGQDVTFTKIGKELGKQNKIVFINDSDAELTIAFDKDMEDGGANKVKKIRVLKKQKNEVNFVLDQLKNEVKYTATITGAIREDPIIIIDR